MGGANSKKKKDKGNKNKEKAEPSNKTDENTGKDKPIVAKDPVVENEKVPEIKKEKNQDENAKEVGDGVKQDQKDDMKKEVTSAIVIQGEAEQQYADWQRIGQTNDAGEVETPSYLPEDVVELAQPNWEAGQEMEYQEDIWDEFQYQEEMLHAMQNKQEMMTENDDEKKDEDEEKDEEGKTDENHQDKEEDKEECCIFTLFFS